MSGAHCQLVSRRERWRRWRRYRRFLASLVRDDRRNEIPVTAARVAELKDTARRAAREVDRHRKDD